MVAWPHNKGKRGGVRLNTLKILKKQSLCSMRLFLWGDPTFLCPRGSLRSKEFYQLDFYPRAPCRGNRGTYTCDGRRGSEGPVWVGAYRPSSFLHQAFRCLAWCRHSKILLRGSCCDTLQKGCLTFVEGAVLETLFKGPCSTVPSGAILYSTPLGGSRHPSLPRLLRFSCF